MWNNIKRFFKYKDLILQLAIKNLKVSYRRPVFGFFWTLIIPFCIAIVYKIVFSEFMHVRVVNYPFFIYIITALLPWRYFQSSLSEATYAILGNKNLVHKVPFPRELLPVSVVIANLINFLPSIVVILIVIGAFDIGYTSFIIFLPFVILLHTILIFGLSLFFSALQVIYRDVQYMVEIIILTLFFLTPGIYSLHLVTNLNSDYLINLYLLNPLVGILNLYRLTLLGGFSETLPSEITIFNTLISPIIFSVVILVIGIYVFKKCEKKFSDYIDI